VTESQRQEIKAKLIELRFWGADEFGDPAADRRDALTLYNRAVERLAKGAGLYSTGLTAISKSRKIEVKRGELTYRLADGQNFPEAICLAALAMPQFLKRHPECARGGKI
jgi:hypothetical protein